MNTGWRTVQQRLHPEFGSYQGQQAAGTVGKNTQH
jgi:hypothetical protein